MRAADQRWRLDGQVAMVTGASAGIGQSIARELLGFGADVLLVARDAGNLEDVRAELEEDHSDRIARAFPCDLADEEARRELFDWIEDLGCGLNILVNNVGTNQR